MINNQTNNSLLVLLWNCNGILNHTNELIAILHEKRIDIALIAESHLTVNSRLNIPGYQTISSNHPDGTAHAGSAILIRSSIQFNRLPIYNKDYLQACAISMTINHIPLTIAAAYCPPRHNITPDQFNTFFNYLGHNFLVGGDINAKHPHWGCRTSNPRGNTLLQIISHKQYKVHSPPDPTYWPTSPSKRPDILDIFISNVPNGLYQHTENFNFLLSDHSAVLLTLSASPPIQSLKPSLTNKNTDWDSFRSQLSYDTNLNIKLKSPEDIEDAITKLNQSIQRAAWNSTPISQPSLLFSINIPAHIRHVISEKRRARSQWQRTKYPSDKNRLNSLSTQLKRLMSNFRNQSFNNYIASLSFKDGSIWKATKKALREKPSYPPLKQPDNTWAIEDPIKADLFKTHLTEVFKLHNNINNTAFSNEIEQFLLSPLQMTLPPKAFSPAEVQHCIDTFPKRKAPGFDLITYEVAKHLPRKTLILLTYIFNSIIRLSYFPLQWKFSIIIVIPKPGKPPDIPSSYRPISLLPFFSKVLEKLVLKRISPIINNSKIIPNSQFGFRNRHSTIHQVNRITDTIASALEKKQYCNAVFLDVAQAFDRVWHPGLLFKLKKILPPAFYLFFKSYLVNRQFAVRYRSSLSSISTIEAGVPQGAITAPVLFNIFIADQPTSPHTFVAEYADDKAILSTHENPITASFLLQSHLSRLESWCRNWKVKINETKSCHITFTLKHQICPPISFNNITIPTSPNTKYLGIFFDKKLNWAHHTHNIKIKLNSRLRSLKFFLNAKSKLSLHTKLNLYKTLLKPIWMYGIQIWGSAKKSHINKIQITQNKLFRLITKAPFYVSNQTLHSDLKMNTVLETASKSYSRYHNSLFDHPNILAKNLTNPMPGNPPKRLKRKWCRDLLL